MELYHRGLELACSRFIRILILFFNKRIRVIASGSLRYYYFTQPVPVAPDLVLDFKIASGSLRYYYFTQPVPVAPDLVLDFKIASGSLRYYYFTQPVAPDLVLDFYNPHKK
jgi:hypothetical protein